MRNNTLPAVIYHPLQDISTKNELEVISTLAQSSLDKGHISSIVNAFYLNTRICRNGIPYIRAKGVASILRTGNSGAERPLIYQGISGVLAPSAIVEIDGEDYISGPSLLALISTRISMKSGITKEYLSIAFNLSVVTNPFKALDLNNGVIILKSIHANLTRQNIHTFEQLYRFCKDNHYSLDWAD